METTKKSGFVEITKQQLIQFQHDIEFSGGSYNLMKIIQEAGGPISGVVDLRADMVNFEWTREDFMDTAIFKWREL